MWLLQQTLTPAAMRHQTLLSICAEGRHWRCDHAQEKAQYRDAFERLRGLKSEIEHRQRIAAQDRARHHAEFGRWLAVMRRQAGLPAPTEAAANGDTVAPVGSNPSVGMARDAPSTPALTAMATRTRAEIGSTGDSAAPREAAAPGSHTEGPAAAAIPQRSVSAASEPPPRSRHAASKSEVAPAGQKPEDTRPQAVTAPLTADIDLQLRDGLQKNDTPLVDDAHERKEAQISSALTNCGFSAHRAESAQPESAADTFADVDPEVLAAAKPMLTGNAAADRSIIQFYEARAALLRSQAFRRTL